MVVYHDHTGPPDSRGSDEAETSITIDNIVFVALAMEQDMGGKTTTLFGVGKVIHPGHESRHVGTWLFIGSPFRSGRA